MTIHLGIIMDPIHAIDFQKDSTLAIAWEAATRGWVIHYFEQKDLFVRDGKAFGNSRLLTVFNNPDHWFSLDNYHLIELSELPIILMRKDPPFNLEYIYTTYILELAERAGVNIFNKPQSLRDANEKFFTSWFPELCPATLITRDIKLLRDFHREQKEIICKPLAGMGGASVFRLKEFDSNANVIFETLTQQENNFIMAQRFIPEITMGDKRILLINGEPIPFALARIPAIGDHRGNLAAGAKGIAQPLTKQDLKICEIIKPVLREKKLIFVGLDVIGDFITEINITSPTGIRELDTQCQLNISSQLLDALI